MNLISLNIRPLLAILVSLCASGLIYVLGDHIKENAREAITFIAAIDGSSCFGWSYYKIRAI